MRHYELVLLTHPDRLDQGTALCTKIKQTVTAAKGSVSRFEQWGVLPLAFLIAEQKRAQYYLFNLTCDQEVMISMEADLKLDKSLMRHLLIRRRQALSEPSNMLLAIEQTRKDEAEAAAAAEAESKMAEAAEKKVQEEKVAVATSAEQADSKEKTPIKETKDEEVKS